MRRNALNTGFFVSSYEMKHPEEKYHVFSTREVNLKDLTRNRCVILTLPGAFTPTCTYQHVPSFEDKYDEIRSYGVNEVYILTINDFFTQRVWLDAMGVTKLKAISDMELVFGNNLNNAIYRDELGVRNQREILVFDNCKVEKRFTEVYESNIHDPFDKTKVENLLDYLKTL